MKKSYPSRPGLLRMACAAALLAPVPVLWGIHAKNAGPQDFEIKFKLPVSKALSPEEEMATFALAPGFLVELVAAEPLVESPVSMAWDEKGRLFVCEMRGYMQDSEGAGEDQPVGRIALLEDTDGDGRMDKRTLFADKLVMPRAVMCVRGGVLVAEPPNLFYMKDTDGDGVADVREVVDDAYGTAGGQPEHMANSPTWFMDNWIYSANHSKRYRLKDGKFVSDSSGKLGQWGLTQDDFGRPYYNSNSDFLRGNLLSEALLKRNPNYTFTAALGVQILKDQSVWPSHPTPGVNRGYDEKTLREDGTLSRCTATCGAGIYRGSLFPAEYHGNAFIPEPAANLVKRVLLTEKEGVVTGANATEGSEFWTSTDERFRPVNAYAGPDGGLYVVDLYRGIIQHKGFLTHYLHANIQERKLETPFNTGRIWRVVPESAKQASVRLPEDSSAWVDALASAEGWVRDTAQRVLVERRDATTIPSLVAMAAQGKTWQTRVHALWTLDGIGGVSSEVVSAGVKDAEARVRAVAVQLAGRTQLAELDVLKNEKEVLVQSALAAQWGAYPEAQESFLTLAQKAGDNALVREALVSGLRGRELEMLRAMLERKGAPTRFASPLLEALSQAVYRERQKERIAALLDLIEGLPPASPEQKALLSGIVPKSRGKTPVPPRLIYLEKEPALFSKLAKSADKTTALLVTAVDGLVAWPGKPGVPPPPVIKPLTGADLALFENGRNVYSTLCAGCHQPNGTGLVGLAPALVDSEWVLGNPEALPRILLHGLSGPIKVAGQTWDLEMPPLGAALTDEQIAGVLTYIRRSWEHNASPVSVAVVAKIRKDNAQRSKSWTEPEIRALLAAGSAKKTAATPATGKSAGSTGSTGNTGGVEKPKP
jgi:mono/diheme cytochrome c family protein/glucose/arabinose dehydrogenase